MLKNNSHIISISGTGRSGTNITKKLLNKNNNVFALPFEYRFTIDPFGIIDIYNTLKYSWSPYIVHSKIIKFEKLLTRIGKKNYFRFIAGKIIKAIDKKGLLVTPPGYADWELDKWFPNYLEHLKVLKDNLIDFEYNGTWPGEKFFQIQNRMKFVAYNKNLNLIFREFLESLINDVLSKHYKTHFVEDNTWSILFASDLLEILPESKFIHVYRDPRDVVTSFMYQRWTPSKFEDNIKYYSSIMSRIIQVKNEIPDDNILEIKFENLIQYPDQSLKQICDYCELSFCPDMLNIDLSSGNLGRWKKELDTDYKERINNELKYYINYLGYENWY